MNNFIRKTVVTATLTFASAGLFLANAQQLQSDGTMSQQAAQQTAPTQDAMPKHARNPAHEAKHLSKQLGLTPDQTSQLQPILADRDSRMAALHTDTTLAPKAMHKQGHAIELDTQSKINAILTPAQQQTYADVRAAHKKGHGGPESAPAPTPNA